MTALPKPWLKRLWPCRSLMTLGLCIKKLVEGQSHIPYRDSKLTYLLQVGIGVEPALALQVLAGMKT